ncbi:hypothetical protein UFOVP806_24 [uncultured Caudovirales phage]|uniref:Uncharacterized protein n=1 Tax=uncultured Caudovirales phage TaxID=2100421 RepID=A0A6J5P2G0_9CAUD|nr:hypothetical protein UFOVP806_24 [uncultured Caudovirales phage]
MRPKSSGFKFTDARRLAYANKLRANKPSPETIFLAVKIESGIGRTTTKVTSNQRKRRHARRQAWAAGDRHAFAA